MQKISKAYQNVCINSWSNVLHEYISSLSFNSPNRKKGSLSAVHQKQRGNSFNFPNTQSYIHHSYALYVIRHYFRMRNSLCGAKLSGCKQDYLWCFHLQKNPNNKNVDKERSVSEASRTWRKSLHKDHSYFKLKRKNSRQYQNGGISIFLLKCKTRTASCNCLQVSKEKISMLVC